MREKLTVKRLNNVAILLLILPLLMLGLISRSAMAQEFEKNILTGGPKGTYIQIGRNLAKLGQQCGRTLNVVESAGSLENLVGVRSKLNTQFGIVQSDVLDYLKAFQSGDKELQNAIWGVRIMFPLYNEEIHILARKEIRVLSDLAGKKVAIGKKDSGTFLTASLILDIMKIKSAERMPIGSGDALPALLNGEIDAMFYVAGAPAKLFSDPRIDGSKFHLLPLNETPLLTTYIPSTIKAGTYPFMDQAVDVVAVKAVLMTYEYRPEKNEYQKQSCKAVSDFSNLLVTNLDRLKKEGHPKWNNVDLSAVPPGWKVANCVKKGIALDYKLQCTAPKSALVTPAYTLDKEYLNLLKQRLKKKSN